MNSKTKTVHFNLDDAGEKWLLDTIESQGRFSTIVKRLLFLQLNGVKVDAPQPKKEQKKVNPSSYL